MSLDFFCIFLTFLPIFQFKILSYILYIIQLIQYSIGVMYKAQQKLRTKKRIKINSLEAAICNVALFKSMKDKDFRDSIFISYCEEGVFLESMSEQQWKRANDYIENFLHNKKIQLLTDGYEKQAYQGLINKGLKQITRKIREKDEQCPYINIIHYQKLRKSCQYMDKQKYSDPLNDWEKKNKKNPNFAFLIVEPKTKFDEVKRSLLEYLSNEPVVLEHLTLDPIYFMYLLFYSPIKQKLRSSYNRRQIQIYLQKNQDDNTQVIKVTNFTNINLQQYSYSVIKGESIARSGVGLQVIPCCQLKQQVENAKLYCKEKPNDIIEAAIKDLTTQYGQNFVIVTYKKEQEQKYKSLIEKYTNTKFSKQEIERKLQSHRICQFDDIQFVGEIKRGQSFKIWKVCINSCPFIVHEYDASQVDISTFMIYLDQLQLYYCTFIIRYYGIAVRYSRSQVAPYEDKQSYFLIFDYHRNTLEDMKKSDIILDNMQIASISLQIFYLLNFLHSHEQPRCFGLMTAESIFWPMAAVLPYLGQNGEETMHSIENDVRQVGLLMQQFLGQNEDEDLSPLIRQMTKNNKYERPSVRKCITQLQQLLCL